MAEIVLICDDFDAALAYYTDELGFRIDAIFPADSPRTADLSGHELRLRLQLNAGRRRNRGNDWTAGRAGMQYRDLVPDRLGGRLIASHIRIPDGGPVPDYVHHHAVAFQVIHCYRGWVRVLYEDQGDAIVMHAGDSVLQPPHIRHRVVESSAGLEVVEVTSPAEHETFVDHDMKLPTGRVAPNRTFGGQRFVFHRRETGTWVASEIEACESMDTGIRAATSGLVSVSTVRPLGATTESKMVPDMDTWFCFVLEGSATLASYDGLSADLHAGEAFVIAGSPATLRNPADDFEMLVVRSASPDA